MKYISFFILTILISCTPSKPALTAQQIIDKSIIYSGADKTANSQITFRFRDANYSAIRKNGHFKLIKTNNAVTDILSNNGFKRFSNNQEINISDSIAKKHANAVNSVHYFSVLPFSLNDKAVHKKLLPSSTLNGKEYYKIQVTFSKDGGGEDFEDVFIYWIRKEDFLIDFLAYSYHTNGGGKRFRVLKEECVKNGIRFVDYFNFKPKSNDIQLVALDKAFLENRLTKISEIVLKDIQVKL